VTPEKIQAAIMANRLQGIYNAERDTILAAIGRAYAEMLIATSHYNVLSNRVSTGDLTSLQPAHGMMQAAMGGQDAIIQQAFNDTMTVLETAQATVYAITGGRFLPDVPLEVPNEIVE
jgi:hypothetical protein